MIRTRNKNIAKAAIIVYVLIFAGLIAEAAMQKSLAVKIFADSLVFSLWLTVAPVWVLSVSVLHFLPSLLVLVAGVITYKKCKRKYQLFVFFVLIGLWQAWGFFCSKMISNLG